MWSSSSVEEDHQQHHHQIPNELTDMTDMYGVSVIIWELFNTRIPWDGLSWCDIYERVVCEQRTLHVDFTLIPLPFSRIIKDGFNVNPMQRMSFDEVKSLLESYQQTLDAQKYLLKKKLQQQEQQQPHFKQNSSSFSEGIADLNQVVNNENEMAATMNESLENLDKLSVDGGGRSFICCDSYRAEVHLTNSSLNNKNRSRSANNLKDQTNRKNSKKKKAERSKSSTRHNENKNEQRFSTLPPPPYPPPPPPPPPPPQTQNDDDQLNLPSPPTHTLLSKLNQQANKTSKRQPLPMTTINTFPEQLPPTPPPSITQLQKKFSTINNNSINNNKGSTPGATQQQHSPSLNAISATSNKFNLPLPPTYQNTSPLSELRSSIMSKSVDSPRTPLHNNYTPFRNNPDTASNALTPTNGKHYNNNNDQPNENANNNNSCIIRRSELFEKIVAKLEKNSTIQRNSSLNDLTRYTADTNNNNDQNTNSNQRNTDEMNDLDTSLSLLKGSKFKVLENFYRLDFSVITPDNKQKLFNLIQKREALSNQNLIKQHQDMLQSHPIPSTTTTTATEETTQTQRIADFESEQERINRFNYNFNKFDQFRNNLQGPTPDDKKRYISKMNKNTHVMPQKGSQLNTTVTEGGLGYNELNQQHQQHHHIQARLDMSNISQEDNTIEKRNKPPLNRDQPQAFLRNSRARKTISPQTCMTRSISLTNPTPAQKLLNSETAEAIAVAKNNGILSSIKASLSKEASGSRSNLMDSQVFYQMAQKINQTNIEEGQTSHDNQDFQTQDQYDYELQQKYQQQLQLQQQQQQNHTNNNTHTKPFKHAEPLRSGKNVNNRSSSTDPGNTRVLPNLKQQKACTTTAMDVLNSGSVKSLVQSYEEFPHKETHCIDSKVIQMKVERLKEIENDLEQGRIALASNCDEMQQQDNQNQFYEDQSPASIESPGLKLSSQQPQHPESSTPNETTTATSQALNRMQKELSTISERTEIASPPRPINTSNPNYLNSNSIRKVKGGCCASLNNNSPLLLNTAAATLLTNTTMSGSTFVATTPTMTTATQGGACGNSTKLIRNNHLDLTSNSNTNSNSQATILNQRFTFMDLNSTREGATSNTQNTNNNAKRIISVPVQTLTQNQQNNFVNNINLKQAQSHDNCSSSDEDSSDPADSEEESDDESDDESDYSNNQKPKNNNNNNSKTKSFYSSQEDLLISSMHSFGEIDKNNNTIHQLPLKYHKQRSDEPTKDQESIIECSEAVYLKDFDKLASKYNGGGKSTIRNKTGETVSSPLMVNCEHVPVSLPYSEKHRGTVTASIGLGPNQIITNTYPRPAAFVNSKKFSVDQKMEPEYTNGYYVASQSQVATNVIPPPPPPLPSQTFNKQAPQPPQLSQQYSNHRTDKHIIDTSKFKGYSYKMETTSNVENQSHNIKSVLTNPRTGHQFLLANTKVKSPNIQTKVIIDK
jgi:hypothetical protein